MVVKSQRNNKQDEAGKGIFINENEREENTMKIGFIGLGLIGGSIAKAIRQYYPDYDIIAFDKNKESLQKAKEIAGEKASEYFNKAMN